LLIISDYLLLLADTGKGLSLLVLVGFIPNIYIGFLALSRLAIKKAKNRNSLSFIGLLNDIP